MCYKQTNTVYMLLNLDEKTIVISKFINSVLAVYSHLNRLMTIYNVNILHANSFWNNMLLKYVKGTDLMALNYL